MGSPLQCVGLLLLRAASLAAAEPGAALHGGNPACWAGTEGGAFSARRCCAGADASCWDGFYDRDACCLSPDGVIFIPGHCPGVVMSQMLIAGREEVRAATDRPSLSAKLFAHASNAMQLVRWALPPADSSRALSVLDLGTGMGALNVLLNRHYDGRARFTYVDRSELDAEGMVPIASGRQHGYGQRHPFYGDLRCARDIARLNGVGDVRAVELSADGEGLAALAPRSVDLLLSVASWGFHYPIGMHLRQVARILRPGGVLIVTLRRGTDGLSAMRRGGFWCMTRQSPNNLKNVTKCIRRDDTR